MKIFRLDNPRNSLYHKNHSLANLFKLICEKFFKFYLNRIKNKQKIDNIEKAINIIGLTIIKNSIKKNNNNRNYNKLNTNLTHYTVKFKFIANLVKNINFAHIIIMLAIFL